MKITYIFLFIFLIFLSSCAKAEYNTFAQCLTENGAKMYGTEWCSYCKGQKESFGGSFQYVDYIDCDKNPFECTSNGVQGYPTWIINEEKYPGIQPLERLGELTGCELVKDNE